MNFLLANVRKIVLLVARYILILGISLLIFNSFKFLKFLFARSIMAKPIPRPMLVNSVTNSWLTVSILGIKLTLF